MIQKTTFSISRLLYASLLLAALSGCSTTIASFGTLSIEPIDQDAKYVLVGKNVEGEALVYLLWCIPLGIPSIEKAARDLLNKYDGDYIDNVNVQNYFFWTYLFGKYGYKVTGNVYRRTAVVDTAVNIAKFRLYRNGRRDTLIETPYD
ncbi:MAG: hypothetical protein JXA71_07070 [Chitinispirillaceae bacterium]|nr:hypothetical protein [Chitinispirillaceae bacterium]